MEQIELLRIESEISAIGNKQLAVEPGADADLGFRMWGGKDAHGGTTKFLGKDKPARVKSLAIQDLASATERGALLDMNGNLIPGTSSGHTTAGFLTTPAVTSVSSGSVQIEAAIVRFYKNAAKVGTLVELEVPAATVTVPVDVGALIVADYNDGSPIYRAVQSSLTPLYNISDVIPIWRVWYAMGRFHSICLGDYGNGLAERIAFILARTQFYQRVNNTGLNLTRGTSRGFLISAARVSAGPTEQVVSAFDSANHNVYLLSRNSGTWNENSIVHEWQNQYYMGSGGLTVLPDSKFGVNYIYRTIGNDIEAFMIPSNQYYNTEDKALADTGWQNSDLPPVVPEHSKLVGRIIFQKSATTGLFQDVFTNPWSAVVVESGGTGTDQLVKTSASDSTSGYLISKLTVGAGLDIDEIDVLDPVTQEPTGATQLKIVRTEEITVMTPATVFSKILGDIEANASNVPAGQWIDVRFAPINFPTGSIESIDILPVPGSGFDTSVYNFAIYGNDTDSLVGSALWFGLRNVSLTGKTYTLTTPFPIVRKKFNWVAFAARGSGRFVSKSVNAVVPASGNDAAVGVISNWIQDGAATPWPTTLADTTHNSGPFPYIQFNIAR